MPGIRHGQGVVRKGRVAVPVVGKVRHTNRAVSLYGERNVARPAVASAGINEAGIKIDRVPRSTESQAAAKSVTYRHALHPSTKACDQPPDFRYGMRDPAPVQILVSDGHDFLALACAERGHTSCALAIEEVGC